MIRGVVLPLCFIGAFLFTIIALLTHELAPYAVYAGAVTIFIAVVMHSLAHRARVNRIQNDTQRDEEIEMLTDWFNKS